MNGSRTLTILSLIVPSLLGSTASTQQARQAPGLTPGPLQVIGTLPAAISTAPVTTAVTVKFDRPVLAASIDAASFRVFGRHSGAASGTYLFSHGGRWVTLVPDDPFSAGEVVWVNLSHDVRGTDLSKLRRAGYAFQFGTEVAASTGTFQQIASMSNNMGEQTRIYGAAATDLNGDGYLDLTTVNEVSADLRVFLNLADGTGAYSNYLTPTPIGVEASPNEPADFDNDGNADLCISATDSESVWIVLGNGDGTFGGVQEIPVGQQPHGIVALDVDGDGDLDVVNANRGSDDLALLLNDGTGTFGAPTFFEGGVDGEYGLAAGDMNGDGVADLVVAGIDGSHLACQLGQGDGTFSAAGPAQSSGGETWVVQLGDIDGDGDLDASAANSTSGNGAMLKGNGDGTFGAPAVTGVGAHVPATDLGDLDGDGDLDWILSSFGGGFWRLYRNNGSGSYSFWQQINAPSNPSCAIPLDIDNDGDLDLALTDEIADVVVLRENL